MTWGLNVSKNLDWCQFSTIRLLSLQLVLDQDFCLMGLNDGQLKISIIILLYIFKLSMTKEKKVGATIFSLGFFFEVKFGLLSHYKSKNDHRWFKAAGKTTKIAGETSTGGSIRRRKLWSRGNLYRRFVRQFWITADEISYSKTVLKPPLYTIFGCF